MHLEKLKLVDEIPQTAVDPKIAGREKMLAAIDEQIAAAEAALKGETFTRAVTQYVETEDGERVRKQVQKEPRKWFKRDVFGRWYVQVRYGNRPLAIQEGQSVIDAGEQKNVVTVLRTLRSAVEAGELDDAISKARQGTAATLKKGNKR